MNGTIAPTLIRRGVFWRKHLLRLEERWKHTILVRHQPEREENLAFVYQGVLFIGLNMVSGQKQSSEEWETRLAQNLEWTKQGASRQPGTSASGCYFGTRA